MKAFLVVDTSLTLTFFLLLPIAFLDLAIDLQLDVADELGGVHSSPIAVVLGLHDIGLDHFLNAINCGYPCCFLLSEGFDARFNILKSF